MQIRTEADEAALKTQSELLAGITGVEPHIARRVLEKYGGNVEKAADALLSGDRGLEDAQQHPQHHENLKKHRTTPEPSYHESGRRTAVGPGPSANLTPAASTSGVVDLTGEDEDDPQLRQAMELSMGSQTAPQFQRSDRAPDPNWQMVRSNEPIGPSAAQQEEQSIHEAIQASLQDLPSEADSNPYKAAVREGGRPVAIRPNDPGLAYLALTLQALYAIPQVRSAVANLPLPEVDAAAPLDSHDRAMTNVIELFTHMDLAQLSALVDTEVLSSLGLPPFNDSRHSSLPDVSEGAIRQVTTLLEMFVESSQGEGAPHLFSFSHARVNLSRGLPRTIERNSMPSSFVPMNVDQFAARDLMGALEELLNSFDARTSWHDVIVDASDVVTFSIKRDGGVTTPRHGEPFSFPKTMYFDRIMFHNLELANAKRLEEADLKQDIQELMKQRDLYTKFKDRDALKDLRTTMHYYEKVAQCEDTDLERKRLLNDTLNHLNDIALVLEGKIEDINHKIEELQAKVKGLFDVPELQQFRYDLRAVLVHAGFLGRSQYYSYVQDIDGVWWKTVDQTVKEVSEETVLTGTTGIHLGAGPFALFYSRHVSEEMLREPLIWPAKFTEAVEENNRKFLAVIHPELGEVFSHASASASSSASPPPRSSSPGTTMQMDSSPPPSSYLATPETFRSGLEKPQPQRPIARASTVLMNVDSPPADPRGLARSATTLVPGSGSRMNVDSTMGSFNTFDSGSSSATLRAASPLGPSSPSLSRRTAHRATGGSHMSVDLGSSGSGGPSGSGSPSGTGRRPGNDARLRFRPPTPIPSRFPLTPTRPHRAPRIEWRSHPKRDKRLLDWLDMHPEDANVIFSGMPKMLQGTKLSECTRAAVAVFEVDEDEVAREGVKDDPKKFGKLVARHLLNLRESYREVNERLGKKGAVMEWEDFDVRTPMFRHLTSLMETFPHWKRLHVHWRTRGNYNQFWDDDPVAGQTRGSHANGKRPLEGTDSEWDELESETEDQSPSKKQKPDPIERQPALAETPDPTVQPAESPRGSWKHPLPNKPDHGGLNVPPPDPPTIAAIPNDYPHHRGRAKKNRKNKKSDRGRRHEIELAELALARQRLINEKRAVDCAQRQQEAAERRRQEKHALLLQVLSLVS